MEDLLKEFYIDKEQLQAVSRFFCRQLQQGLGKSTHRSADVKSYVTCVTDLPTGEEVGRYVVLDLSGIDIRILLVTLKGYGKADIDSEIYTLTDDLIHGRGFKLFDYIAKCLSGFVKGRYLESTPLQLGFTFSFPIKHRRLDEAILIKWTKGFKCTGVIDRDVVKLLKEAIERQGDIQIEVVSVLNDVIGTLISCAYSNPNCRIGLIVDNSCNAAYMEQTTKAELLDDGIIGKKGSTIAINLEWGTFGENGCLNTIRTDYDRDIDRKSYNKGEEIFDKMVSGAYIGEIFRLILLKATKLNLIFKKYSGKNLMEILTRKNIFKTSHISLIEEDCLPDYWNTRKLLSEKLLIAKPGDDDIQLVRMISEALFNRSAMLVGACLSVLINRVNKDNVVVGLDGSILHSNRKYIAYMQTAMRRMINPKLSYQLMLTENGPARGSALVYACNKPPKAIP